MVKTAAGHDPSFHTYAKFHLEFLGQIHLKSWSGLLPQVQTRTGPKEKESQLASPFTEEGEKTAYMVEEEPWEYDDSYEPEAEKNSQKNNLLKTWTQDTAVALTAVAECDDEETDVTEELGDAALYQLMAFVAVDQMKGKCRNKGKGFGKKGGKGEGKGKHVFRTQLSAQDRIARLAKLKAGQET